MRARGVAALVVAAAASAAIVYLLVSHGHGHDGAPAGCSRLLAWRSGPGFGDKVRAETELDGMLGARTPAEASSRFGALMAATADGLRHPPPGPARESYVTALNEFRTAGLDLRDNNVDGAMTVTQRAITADQKATATLASQVAGCRR